LENLKKKKKKRYRVAPLSTTRKRTPAPGETHRTVRININILPETISTGNLRFFNSDYDDRRARTYRRVAHLPKQYFSHGRRVEKPTGWDPGHLAGRGWEEALAHLRRAAATGP